MGMLVTLYLIVINVYASVEAPTSRGFSYIEVWFVGVQMPILFALLEYSCILVVMKLRDDLQIDIFKKKIIKNRTMAMADLVAFSLTGFYFFVFNLFYWTECLNKIEN